MECLFICFFFFKQKTAYEMRISDWSSDVCSSDLCLFGPPGGRKDFPRFTLRFRYAGFCCSDFIHSRRDFLADLSPFGFERFDNYRAHDHHDFIAIGVMCAQLAALGRIESTLQQSAQDRGVDLAPVALSGRSEE